MPDLRPGPLLALHKLAARVKTRGASEGARLALDRLRAAISSDDRLILLARDAARPARSAAASVVARPLTLEEAGPEHAAVYARDIGTDSAASFRARLSPSTRCFLVFFEGRAVHATWATTDAAWTRELRRYLHPPPGDAYTYESFTRPEARGMGAYPFALESICARLAEGGVRRAWVAVESGNEPSLRAVAKAGFQEKFSIAYRRRWGRLTLEPFDVPPDVAGHSFLSRRASS